MIDFKQFEKYVKSNREDFLYIKMAILWKLNKILFFIGMKLEYLNKHIKNEKVHNFLLKITDFIENCNNIFTKIIIAYAHNREESNDVNNKNKPKFQGKGKNRRKIHENVEDVYVDDVKNVHVDHENVIDVHVDDVKNVHVDHENVIDVHVDDVKNVHVDHENVIDVHVDDVKNVHVDDVKNVHVDDVKNVHVEKIQVHKINENKWK